MVDDNTEGDNLKVCLCRRCGRKISKRSFSFRMPNCSMYVTKLLFRTVLRSIRPIDVYGDAIYIHTLYFTFINLVT